MSWSNIYNANENEDVVPSKVVYSKRITFYIRCVRLAMFDS